MIPYFSPEARGPLHCVIIMMTTSNVEVQVHDVPYVKLSQRQAMLQDELGIQRAKARRRSGLAGALICPGPSCTMAASSSS